jgi:predicted RNA binding protein YcfA (HicA-like mRNA interferase family)
MPYKFRDIEKRLKRIGFSIVRQGKGSHVIFSNGLITFPVPNHKGQDISKGVEGKILSILKLSAEEFKNLI